MAVAVAFLNNGGHRDGENRNARQDLSGADMNADPATIFERTRRRFHRTNTYRQAATWAQVTGRGKFLAPLDGDVMDTGQIDCRPLSTRDQFDDGVVVAQAANAYFTAPRYQIKRVADVCTSRDDRAGHDGSMPLDRKGAVDGQPERGRAGSRWRRAAAVAAAIVSCSRTSSRPSPVRRSYEPWVRIRKRSGNKVADFLRDQIDPFIVGDVTLGQGDHAGGNIEQPEDLQVLPGLRFYRVVGRDHEQCDVEPGRSTSMLRTSRS